MAVVDLENDRLEWKEIWKNDYLKVIAAFYNTDGGTLVVGRNDSGDYVGVNSPNKVAKEISDTISNKIGIQVAVHIRTVYPYVIP